MGKRWIAIRGFVSQDLKYLFTSAKLYVVLCSLAIGLLTCFRGFAEYLSSSGNKINPLELYTVCVSNRVSLWIVYIGEVVLLCDAPFRRRGDYTRLLHSSRRVWMTGQFLFSTICVLLYTLFLVLFFTALSWGHWCFSDSWSETYLRGTISGESVGILYAIVFWPELLSATPLTAFLMALLLQIIFGLFISCVISLLHLLSKPKAGIVFCTALPLVDYLLLTTFDFPWCWTVARFLSPFSLSSFFRLSMITSLGPSVRFAVFYLLFLLVLLLAAMYQKVKTYDFFSI